MFPTIFDYLQTENRASTRDLAPTSDTLAQVEDVATTILLTIKEQPDRLDALHTKVFPQPLVNIGNEILKSYVTALEEAEKAQKDHLTALHQAFDEFTEEENLQQQIPYLEARVQHFETLIEHFDLSNGNLTQQEHDHKSARYKQAETQRNFWIRSVDELETQIARLKNSVGPSANLSNRIAVLERRNPFIQRMATDVLGTFARNLKSQFDTEMRAEIFLNIASSFLKSIPKL